MTLHQANVHYFDALKPIHEGTVYYMHNGVLMIIDTLRVIVVIIIQA